ncbi:hypothetical protein HOY82DRAFT_631084 [Tuber indicum]|nr:hypothetical protein HOY82DRAFT_631084 [Tuber indicum]
MTTGRRINSNLLGQREPRALIDEAKVSQGAIGEGKPPSTAQVVGYLSMLGTEIPGTPPVVSSGRWERVETKEAEIEALSLERGVQYRPSPRAMVDCLPKEGHECGVPQDLEGPRLHPRVDYRGLLVCSIDPPGREDIGDALHASRMPNGKYEVNVHIADVTHFVKPNAARDDGASVKSNHLIRSLKTHVERFAFSVFWEMTESGDVVDSRFSKSMIKPERRAHTAHKDPAHTIQEAAAEAYAAVALNQASPDFQIESEMETSDPINVKTKETLEEFIGTEGEDYEGGLHHDGLRERDLVFDSIMGVEGFTSVRDLAPVEQESRFYPVTYTLTVDGSTGRQSGIF